MRAFNFALACLIGLLGLSTVVALPGQAPDLPNKFVNSATQRFYCENGNLIRCVLDGCALFEKCSDGCEQHLYGANCHVQDEKREVTQEEREVNDINQPKKRLCNADHTAILTCTADFCSVKFGDVCTFGNVCHDSCACCLPKATQKKREATQKKREVNNANQWESKMCASDHSGVMTCNSGFCSVQPGDYCKHGKHCHDDCACCKKP